MNFLRKHYKKILFLLALGLLRHAIIHQGHFFFFTTEGGAQMSQLPESALCHFQSFNLAVRDDSPTHQLLWYPQNRSVMMFSKIDAKDEGSWRIYRPEILTVYCPNLPPMDAQLPKYTMEWVKAPSFLTKLLLPTIENQTITCPQNKLDHCQFK